MTFEFDIYRPDEFKAGTVGPPGQRIFFLQANGDGETVTFKLEKSQVWALASLLAQIAETHQVTAEQEVSVHGELAEPIAAVWTVGSMAAGIDAAAGVVAVLLSELPVQEAGDGGDEATVFSDDADGGSDAADDAETGSRARITLTFGQALGFASHALTLVEDGRDFGKRNGHRPLR